MEWLLELGGRSEEMTLHSGLTVHGMVVCDFGSVVLQARLHGNTALPGALVLFFLDLMCTEYVDLSDVSVGPLYDIQVWGDVIYYTDWGRHTLSAYNRQTGVQTDIATGLVRPTEFLLVDTTPVQGMYITARIL